MLSIADEIEQVRIPSTEMIVFSYRYRWDPISYDVFDRNYNWKTFMEHSASLAAKKESAGPYDISEFYPKIKSSSAESRLATTASKARSVEQNQEVF